MDKLGIQNLRDIIKRINKDIITSFLIILIFLIAIVGVLFVGYRSNEERITSEKFNATFVAFTTKMSQKLIGISKLDSFRYYIHSGQVSRANRYDSLLLRMLNADLEMIAGMDIYTNDDANIFSYGTRADDSVTLDLCYLGGETLNFDIGDCEYKWQLFFKKDAVIQELKKINPELVDCDDCSRSVVSGDYFGDFPMSKFSDMRVNLEFQNGPAVFLWEIIIFISVALLVLVAWNINRIKRIFRNYLSDPIIDITLKIKEDKNLPSVPIEELAYLTNQIDRWKEQVMELEKIKTQEKTKEEKNRTMQSIGASIAHELRTPIRSMISGVSGIEKFLPILLKSYEIASKADLLADVIRPHQVELLQKVLLNLKKEGASANTIIDMFLIKIRGTIGVTSRVENLSIRECVSEALQRYAFQESEEKLVDCNLDKDFRFDGDKILVVHIIFNLLKNALYYIARVHKGEIYIRLEQEGLDNRLYFKDTANGIPDEILPHIFDRFYTKTEGGVGIGLSFCKMAMEWMGGDITCQSVDGEYTEFILHFPIIKG